MKREMRCLEEFRISNCGFGISSKLESSLKISNLSCRRRNPKSAIRNPKFFIPQFFVPSYPTSSPNTLENNKSLNRISNSTTDSQESRFHIRHSAQACSRQILFEVKPQSYPKKPTRLATSPPFESIGGTDGFASTPPRKRGRRSWR